MTQKEISGIGQLVPTRATGVKYGVQYGIVLLAEIKQHGRALPPARWGKVSLRCATAKQLPDGNYFLHIEDGRIFQVKCIEGQWQYQAWSFESAERELRKGSNSISHCLQKQCAAGIGNANVRSIDSKGNLSGEVTRTAQRLGCFPDVFFDKRSNPWATAHVELNAEHGVV
jgi:hypothetical protein